jgi:hypothetical protein
LKPLFENSRIAEQRPHLPDVGAAEDQLRLRGVALVLDRRLHARQRLATRLAAAGEEVGEFVDRDQRSPIRGQAEEGAEWLQRFTGYSADRVGGCPQT